MTSVLPQGEKNRRAVKWIAAQLKDDPDESVNKLVQEAISRFDMTPLEAEMLMQFYQNN